LCKELAEEEEAETLLIKEEPEEMEEAEEITLPTIPEEEEEEQNITLPTPGILPQRVVRKLLILKGV